MRPKRELQDLIQAITAITSAAQHLAAAANIPFLEATARLGLSIVEVIQVR
jgi:hypothetical protein